MSYGRFFAMIAASTVAMFILMYSTVFSTDHIWWSSTKTLMAVYMGATMAVIMLAFMLKMYDDKRKNVAIFVGSAVVFALAFFLFRGQTTVGDVTWMKQMIPHHSLAILTSERANISDPRVRRLADEIILAQRREIAEMEALIGDLEGSDYESAELEPDVPSVTGGSTARTGPVPGAPALVVGDWVGDVLIVDTVKVESDAWVVVHPEAAGGGPDASRVLGRSFVMHGTSERVPVDLEAAPTGAVYVMLHEDTGETGRFEFGTGDLDPPLARNGEPVVASVAAR